MTPPESAPGSSLCDPCAPVSDEPNPSVTVEFGRISCSRSFSEAVRGAPPDPSAKTDDSFFPGFREGTGWGFGVAVQTEGEHAGRYGWSCGQGTDFWIDPDGSFRIVLSQVEMGPEVMGLFTDV